jgi:hypothetical protein
VARSDRVGRTAAVPGVAPLEPGRSPPCLIRRHPVPAFGDTPSAVVGVADLGQAFSASPPIPLRLSATVGVADDGFVAGPAPGDLHGRSRNLSVRSRPDANDDRMVPPATEAAVGRMAEWQCPAPAGVDLVPGSYGRNANHDRRVTPSRRYGAAIRGAGVKVNSLRSARRKAVGSGDGILRPPGT